MCTETLVIVQVIVHIVMEKNFLSQRRKGAKFSLSFLASWRPCARIYEFAIVFGIQDDI